MSISLTRLAVYRLLVDGRGPGSGLTAEEVSGKLNISVQAVRKHIKLLESESYLLKVPGTVRPVFYRRGPKSNILDKAKTTIDNQIDGGTVKDNQDLSNQNNSLNTPLKLDIPTARTHINGRVIFEVLQIGDMHSLAVPEKTKIGPMGNVIPDGDGKRSFPLFPKEPNRDHHNTRSWRCKLPFDGVEVSIELWETGDRSQLFVWPPQLELVPEQFHQAEAMMITRAQQAVNLLAKYGGWQFGIINFKGDIEFASTDDRLLSQIPEDMRSLPGSDLFTDGSHGKGKKAAGRELETKNAETAKLVFDFPNIIKKLESGQETQSSRIYSVEMTAEKLLRVAEVLLEMKAMDLEKETSQLVQDETKKQKANKPTEDMAQAKKGNEDWRMYQ